jgi:hypothetical protein
MRSSIDGAVTRFALDALTLCVLDLLVKEQVVFLHPRKGGNNGSLGIRWVRDLEAEIFGKQRKA